MSIETLDFYKNNKNLWKWHFRDPALRISLLEILESLSADDLIRNIDKREVYHKNKIFVKFYTPSKNTFRKKTQEFLFPSAVQEFKQLLRLLEKNIPAVTPLAFGRCGMKSVLITQEEPDISSMEQILLQIQNCGGKVPDTLLSSWGAFIKKIIDEKIYFADFHQGNLLYSARKNNFVIVDPLGMKSVLHLRKVRLLRMLKRQTSWLLEFGSKKDLLRLLSEISPGKSEQLYEELLNYSSYYVRKLQLPKRIKRFRKNKFTKDNIQYNDRFDRKCLDDCVKINLQSDVAEEVWERDYMCSLHFLPMLHAVARCPGSGIIYRQKNGTQVVSAEDKMILLQRLKICKLPEDLFSFITDEYGRTVLIDRELL